MAGIIVILFILVVILLIKGLELMTDLNDP